MGTHNIIPKAQRKKAQPSFQPIKVQRKMRNLIFLISEALRNFRNQLFNSVEAQRNSAIAERHFRTKLKRNLTFAIEISQHNAKTANYAILDRKRVNNLLKMADNYNIAIETEQNQVQRVKLRY